jgi:acetyl-CoA carboxylase carboxyltransferase component
MSDNDTKYGKPLPVQTTQAFERVSQLSKHLEPPGQPPNSGRKRRKAQRDALPADWSDVLGQVTTLQRMAATPDQTKTGYVRQKQAGKLWVRERVEALVDPGSFKEVGSVAGTVQWKQLSATTEEPEAFTPSNNVQGFAKLKGREVLLTVDDFTIRAGHADGAIWAKSIYMEKLAVALKLPIVKLVDGSSGGGSVSTIKTTGFSYVPPFNGMDWINKQLNGGIPNLGAVLGPAIGLGAARVVSCHFSVMAGDIGSLFNAGPKVVEGATFEEGLSLADLGGPAVHCTNGTIDNLAANEVEAFEQLRTVLSYLPNSGTRIPPSVSCEDPATRFCPELRTLIPRRRERMYSSRRLITVVVDNSSFFEIGALWGRTTIIGLARLAGKPVGIIANNSEVLSGALDAAGSQKLIRHLKFCDVFNLPVIQFVDVPGYAIGTVAERQATMRWGVELTKTYYTTTIPIFSVIVRKAYGVAGSMMLDARDPHMRVGWPSGEWGSLPLDGGIEVGHSAELRKIEKEQGTEAKQQRYKELEEEYRRLMNPVRTANAFVSFYSIIYAQSLLVKSVKLGGWGRRWEQECVLTFVWQNLEEIIDPADTRMLVAKWAEHMYESDMPERVANRMSGRLQPQFA